MALNVRDRVPGYDVIRAVAILVVFLGHTHRDAYVFKVFSPGLTMSLLGFLSAALLVDRQESIGSFLFTRLTRVYSSLLLCLGVVLVAHWWIGTVVWNQQIIVHLLGLSVMIDFLDAPSTTTIGGGLWFISIIVLLYLLSPLIRVLFQHRNGFWHLVALALICTALNLVLNGLQSSMNVIIAFAVGLYCGIHGHLRRMISDEMPLRWPLVGGAVLILLAALATASIIPGHVRGLLFAFYPLAFVPLLFAITRQLPAWIVAPIVTFAGFSYEFYLLHFYLIRGQLQTFVPQLQASQPVDVALSFAVTCLLAYMISLMANWVRKMVETYVGRPSIIPIIFTSGQIMRRVV